MKISAVFDKGDVVNITQPSQKQRVRFMMGFSDADAWDGATRISTAYTEYLFIYFFFERAISVKCFSLGNTALQTYDLNKWPSVQPSIFLSQQAHVEGNVHADATVPSWNIYGVHSGTLKDFYSQKVHSKLMKVCCCKFRVSGAKFMAVGQLESEWSRRFQSEIGSKCYLKVHYLHNVSEPAFLKAMSKASFEESEVAVYRDQTHNRFLHCTYLQSRVGAQIACFERSTIWM